MEKFLLANIILLWVVLLFNLILVLALVRRFGKFSIVPYSNNISTLEIGTKAPDFSAETLDGQSVSLETYSRQDIVLVFVSPTCTPCIEKLDSFELLYLRAKDHRVNLLLVSVVNKEETQVFVDKYSIKVPILVAPQENNSFMKNYKVPGTPFYCFVNNEGNVESTGILDLNWEQLIQKWNVED